MKNIAIITARGGSKRILNKNIKDFCGKPIIAYSIEAALKSGLFDVVMVSTDSQEIKKIAIEYGAAVPFMRSEKNSDDFSTTSDVLKEVLLEYQENGITFDNLGCIYPTAPFITAEILKQAYNKLETENVNGVVPIVQFSFPPQRGFIRTSEGHVVFQYPQYEKTRSQDLEPIYHDVGQFYILKTNVFLKEHTTTPSKCSAIIISESQVQDIDTIEDWEIAEIKYKAYLQRE